MWVLGSKPKSSTRAACALHLRVLPSACVLFWRHALTVHAGQAWIPMWWDRSPDHHTKRNCPPTCSFCMWCMHVCAPVEARGQRWAPSSVASHCVFHCVFSTVWACGLGCVQSSGVTGCLPSRLSRLQWATLPTLCCMFLRPGLFLAWGLLRARVTGY